MGQLIRVTPGLWGTGIWGENFPNSIRLELSHRSGRGVSFFAFVGPEQISLYRPGKRMWVVKRHPLFDGSGNTVVKRG